MDDLVEKLNDEIREDDEIEALNNALKSATLLSSDIPEYQNALQNNGVTDPIIQILKSQHSNDKQKQTCLEYLSNLSNEKKCAIQVGKDPATTQALIQCLNEAGKQENL